MKNVWDLLNICREQLEELGIEYGDIYNVKVNSRAKSRWGRCSSNYYGFEIEISDRLLADDIDDMATLNTMMHEVLHTCDNCMNHGKEWQRLADIVNKAYGYNIKRTTSADEKGIVYESRESYHYIVHCNGCKHQWKYKRHSKIVDCCERNAATCGCGCRSFWVEHI